jgi:hypothetical protein
MWDKSRIRAIASFLFSGLMQTIALPACQKKKGYEA